MTAAEAAVPEHICVNERTLSVVRLLGRGKGGYVYLASDAFGTYAVKKIHHEPSDYYRFGDKLAAETDAYAVLSRLGVTLPALYDVDEAREHLLKQYIPGETVFELAKRGTDVCAYESAVRTLCPRLYAAGINIDYYPTNFIPWDGRLYYVDYEYSPYSDEWNFENWGAACWRNAGSSARVPEDE